MSKSSHEMRRLTERQVDIFTRLINGASMEEVGKDYGIVRERVRQLFSEIRDRLVYWSWVVNQDEEGSAPKGYDVGVRDMRKNKERWLSYLERYQNWAKLDSRSCTK